LGDEIYYSIDLPIINYIGDVLNAQNNPLTKISEKDVKDLVSLFMVETGVSKNKEEGIKLAENVYEILLKKEILLDIKEQENAVEVLDEVVNLGKGYEDKLVDENQHFKNYR